ncbi:MAG: hypothetical protein NVS2B7_21190 [Herpetosiphon sp.]
MQCGPWYCICHAVATVGPMSVDAGACDSWDAVGPWQRAQYAEAWGAFACFSQSFEMYVPIWVERASHRLLIQTRHGIIGAMQ